MKILKPTLIKVIIFVVIIVGAFYYNYNSNQFFIDIDCVPGQEESCARYAKSEKIKAVMKMTLVNGLPVSIMVYVLVGLLESRRKKVVVL